MTQPQPPPVVHPNNQPFYVRETQDWAITQERMRHHEAILWVGEPTLFILLWKVADFEANLVARCPHCQVTDGSVDQRVQQVYNQPLQATCAWCFGTTFDGGVRAKVVRPAIFTDSADTERKSARGTIYPESCTVETLNDFQARTGDYAARMDGSRWQLSQPNIIALRTGYAYPGQVAASLGYTVIPAAREDLSSVVFQIPPNRDELASWLTSPQYWPYPPSNDMVAGPTIPGRKVR
jgi:hypothetical protein